MKNVPRAFPTEFLTPQELSILGTPTQEQLERPYRPIAFQTCPVGATSVRIVNTARQQRRALELKIIQAGLALSHNLYMRLQELDELGNTTADPVFMGPKENRNGKISLVEDEGLTEYVYEQLAAHGVLVLARRVEGQNPHPERW